MRRLFLLIIYNFIFSTFERLRKSNFSFLRLRQVSGAHNRWSMKFLSLFPAIVISKNNNWICTCLSCMQFPWFCRLFTTYLWASNTSFSCISFLIWTWWNFTRRWLIFSVIIFWVLKLSLLLRNSILSSIIGKPSLFIFTSETWIFQGATFSAKSLLFKWTLIFEYSIFTTFSRCGIKGLILFIGLNWRGYCCIGNWSYRFPNRFRKLNSLFQLLHSIICLVNEFIDWGNFFRVEFNVINSSLFRRLMRKFGGWWRRNIFLPSHHTMRFVYTFKIGFFWFDKVWEFFTRRKEFRRNFMTIRHLS